jgi:hypothetical protein
MRAFLFVVDVEELGGTLRVRNAVGKATVPQPNPKRPAFA